MESDKVVVDDIGRGLTVPIVMWDPTGFIPRGHFYLDYHTKEFRYDIGFRAFRRQTKRRSSPLPRTIYDKIRMIKKRDLFDNARKVIFHRDRQRFFC